MDNRDRDAIDQLFDKIARVEAQAGPIDAEAQAYIRQQVAAQPSAPYFMAQTIVVQEQALNEAQRRIDELENRGAQPAGGGGFLESIFGGGQSRSRPTSPQGYSRPGYDPSGRQGYDAGGPWGSRGGMMGGGMGRGMGGGGFLAGAAQTAMGVAGGVVLGNMIGDMLSPDEASAAGLDNDASADNDAAADGNDAGETDVADAGGDFGGDFDAGDF